MKSAIVALALVALAGQALCLRVRRQVDESDAGTLSPLDIKVQSLNIALFYVLNEVNIKVLAMKDTSKLLNRAVTLCVRINGFGGQVDEVNQALLSSVSDLLTEEQQQSLAGAGIEV